MHHRRHIQLHHLFVQWIPPLIGERRRIPMTAGRVRIQIAADEAKFVDAALKFPSAVFGLHSRRLRQHANSREVVRIKRADAMNEIVAEPRPLQAGLFVADVVRHGGGARRKNSQIRAPLALKLQLRVFQAFTNLIVADIWSCRGTQPGILDPGDLALAPGFHFFRCGRVVTVAVDDHKGSLCQTKQTGGVIR